MWMGAFQNMVLLTQSCCGLFLCVCGQFSSICHETKIVCIFWGIKQKNTALLWTINTSTKMPLAWLHLLDRFVSKESIELEMTWKLFTEVETDDTERKKHNQDCLCLLLFYTIATVFQLYHGSDMIMKWEAEILSLHFYRFKGSLTSHTI